MTGRPVEGSGARHYVAGGREHGGGIGRLVGYVVDAAPPAHGSQRVTDTRGPRWSHLTSPVRLLAACGTVVRDRLTGSDILHQFHIAGRGSTLRKLVLGTVARGTGTRYILHLHDYDYAADILARPAWQQRLVAGLFRGADHVAVLGERDRATVRDLLGVAPERVSVLRNCVPDAPPRLDRPADAPVRLLFLGRLGPRKGVPELLRALADPRMPREGWQAVLAGDGPVEAYRAGAAALGLDDRVAMPGWLDEAATKRLLAESDILVLPSHAEGFAMAVLEGLAHGLAVVATPVGAHDEVLRDGENCRLVPPGDSEALAGALADLISDPGLRARLGAAGQALHRSTFSISGYTARLAALHRSVRGEPTARLRSA